MSNSYRLPHEFETDRYYLRRVTQTDASAIYDSYAADEEVTRYLGWRPHLDVTATISFIESVECEWNNGTGFPLVVFPRDAPDNLIGMFHPHLICRYKIGYGYVLQRSAWGQGGASEILSWLVHHAFQHKEIARAQAFCDLDNEASARVMEKSGMTREGILRRYFVHPNISVSPRDCAMYAKVR